MALRILLVDDRPANLRLLGQKLNEAYMLCDQVTDGDTALRRLASAAYDVLIVDLMMPGLNALSICQQLRQHPKNAKIHIVLVTASDDARTRRLSLESGADDFLFRPLNLSLLTIKLRTIAQELALLQQLESRQVALASLAPTLSSPDKMPKSRDTGSKLEMAKIAILVPDPYQGQFLAEFLIHELACNVISYASYEGAKARQTDLVKVDLLLVHQNFSGVHQGLLKARSLTNRFSADQGDVARRAPSILLCLNLQDQKQARMLAEGSPEDFCDESATALELSARIQHLLQRRQVLCKLDRLYAVTLDHISRDGLTGLPNHASATLALDRKFVGGLEGQVATLVLLDLDKLKQLNDDHGHQAGDQVLSFVGKHLKETLASPHYIARWGGDEFIGLLVGSSRDELESLAKNALASVRNSPIYIDSLKGKQTYQASFSLGGCGFASYQKNGGQSKLDWQTLLIKADQALYQAKEKARQGERTCFIWLD